MVRLRGIEVDVSRYPLVVVRYGHQITDAEWSACAARIGELIRRGPFGMINDVRSGSVPSAVQRRTIITLYDENDRDVRAHFLASALVGGSILLRGVLTALTWVRPAPHPMAIFATLASAEEWVLSHFPEELRRLVPRRVASDTRG